MEMKMNTKTKMMASIRRRIGARFYIASRHVEAFTEQGQEPSPNRRRFLAKYFPVSRKVISNLTERALQEVVRLQSSLRIAGSMITVLGSMMFVCASPAVYGQFHGGNFAGEPVKYKLYIWLKLK